MDAYSLIHKKPWSDGLHDIFDQADIDIFENKYRWCLDGDGGGGGGGGGGDDSSADDADSMDSGTGPGNDGLGGGTDSSADDADSMDSGTGPGNDGLSGGSIGGFGDASPGYGGPGVEGDLGSPGIDASPGYGGPGVEGPASLGFGFGPAQAEEPGVFGSIRDAVFGAPEFDPSKNFAYAPEYGVPEEPSVLDMAINTVVGSPLSTIASSLIGGPVGLGVGVLGNMAVESMLGPSIATDPMSYSLGLTDTSRGIGSLASGMGLSSGLGPGPGTSTSTSPGPGTSTSPGLGTDMGVDTGIDSGLLGGSQYDYSGGMEPYFYADGGAVPLNNTLPFRGIQGYIPAGGIGSIV
jgi:hypothetical protein